jgi:hypothetical protein
LGRMTIMHEGDLICGLAEDVVTSGCMVAMKTEPSERVC